MPRPAPRRVRRPVAGERLHVILDGVAARAGRRRSRALARISRIRTTVPSIGRGQSPRIRVATAPAGHATRPIRLSIHFHPVFARGPGSRRWRCWSGPLVAPAAKLRGRPGWHRHPLPAALHASAYPTLRATFFSRLSNAGSPSARWKLGCRGTTPAASARSVKTIAGRLACMDDGIAEAHGLRVGVVEPARPVPGDGSGARHQGHRRTRAGREGAGEVQQRQRCRGAEADQPGILVPAIDDPGSLEDLREAGGRIVGRVEHRPVLVRRPLAEVVIEAGIGRPDVPEVAPTRRVPSASEVDPPCQRAARQDADVRLQRREPGGRRSSGDLRHGGVRRSRGTSQSPARSQIVARDLAFRHDPAQDSCRPGARRAD